MDRARFVVIGAGVTGLSFAAGIGQSDYVVIERETEPGGYCRTVHKDGFIWDYSGHFFHFRHPDIEHWLVSRMAGARVKSVVKHAKIFYRDRLVDFPFQKNIHQLPFDEFIECLVDLFETETVAAKNFKQMLYARFGRGIAEKFLIPYNEKLYATDLSALDVDAMGRFFPHADRIEIVRNFRHADNKSYNATFTYPEGGAFQYVRALMSAVESNRVSLGESVERIDVENKVVHTDRRSIAYDKLVSSAPFPKLLSMCGIDYDPSVYGWNKVLVYNLGFDRKGPKDLHWIYYPDPDLAFYRAGFYDNIFDAERMSLYVEIGYPASATIDGAAIESGLGRVLADLERAGVVNGQKLVAWHSVVLDPAYVHITERSLADVADKRRSLEGRDVFTAGRYGAWTYCSIEDNIVEARALAERLL